jgi:hypothetical protein
MAHDLLMSWRTRGDSAHLVRYEDLILRPAETLTEMFEYLELDSAATTVQEVLSVGSQDVLRLPGSSHEPSELIVHRTLPDPKATIGRWRREGDDSFRDLAQETFKEALEGFGYT